MRLLALAFDREAVGLAVVHDVGDAVARFDASRPETVERLSVVREIDVAKVLGGTKRLKTRIHFGVERRDGIGAVRFLHAPTRGEAGLQPGEQAVVSANGTEKRTVDLDEYIGWVNGVYNFKNRSLGEIMETFERWYDIQVYYETPDLRDITYSGSLKRYGAVNSFLDALELTGDLTYKISGRKVLIYDGMKE